VVNRIGEGEFADIQAVPRARLDRTQEVLLVWPPAATADGPAVPPQP
jgi:hypothetical protein